MVGFGEFASPPRNPRRIVVNRGVSGGGERLGRRESPWAEGLRGGAAAGSRGSVRGQRDRGGGRNLEGSDRAPSDRAADSLSLCLTDPLWLTGWFGPRASEIKTHATGARAVRARAVQFVGFMTQGADERSDRASAQRRTRCTVGVRAPQHSRAGRDRAPQSFAVDLLHCVIDG
jgi:hypothetical protein